MPPGCSGRRLISKVVHQARDLGAVQADEIRVTQQGWHHLGGIDDASRDPTLARTLARWGGQPTPQPRPTGESGAPDAGRGPDRGAWSGRVPSGRGGWWEQATTAARRTAVWRRGTARRWRRGSRITFGAGMNCCPPACLPHAGTHRRNGGRRTKAEAALSARWAA